MLIEQVGYQIGGYGVALRFRIAAALSPFAGGRRPRRRVAGTIVAATLAIAAIAAAAVFTARLFGADSTDGGCVFVRPRCESVAFDWEFDGHTQASDAFLRRTDYTVQCFADGRGWCILATTMRPRSAIECNTEITTEELTASSALVGSSRRRTRGSVTISMPMVTRRSWPPDSRAAPSDGSHTMSRCASSPSNASVDSISS